MEEGRGRGEEGRGEGGREGGEVLIIFILFKKLFQEGLHTFT